VSCGTQMVNVGVDACLWDDAELRRAVCPSAPAGGPPASMCPWSSTAALFDGPDVSSSIPRFPALREAVELNEAGTDKRRRLDSELPVNSLCELLGRFNAGCYSKP
jgi:hypothetical protein